MKGSNIAAIIAPIVLLAAAADVGHAAEPDNARMAKLEARVAELEAARAQEAANKALVRSYFEGTMPKAQRDNIRHRDYIQHSPSFAKYAKKYGLTGDQVNAHLYPLALEMRAAAKAANPNKPAGQPVTQIVAEGDLVFMMRTVYEQDPTEAPGVYYAYNTFELLRIRDGKFYEHWDYGTIQKDDPFLSVPPPAK